MKSNKIIKLILFLALIVPGVSGAQNADTLLKRMDDLMLAPKDKQATVKIILTKTKSNKQKVREAILMQKGRDKKLYRYTAPESQAGIASLSLPGNVMWLYMPAFGAPTKISLLAKSQAFTGTDFSYEDIDSRPFAERFTPKLLSSDDPDVYQLELTPKSDKSKYSKVILSLNKKYFYPEKLEYYDTRGRKFKEAVYVYKKSGKYWYAAEVKMTDLKKEHSTEIIMTDVKFDQGIPDDVFSVENLKQK